MVVIGSKVERNMMASGLLAYIPDILIALAATSFTDNGVIGFFVVLIGLECVYFLIWVKNSLWSWLMYWLSARRKMSTHLEDYLVRNRFPPPPEYVSGIDEYLNKVADNANHDCKVRVKSAIELGTLNGVKLAGKFQYGLQLHLAFEDALQRYARRFPPQQSHEDEEPEFFTRP